MQMRTVFAFAHQLHVFSAHADVFLGLRNYSSSFLRMEIFLSLVHVLSAHYCDFYTVKRSLETFLVFFSVF
jgi:hypothetical protein